MVMKSWKKANQARDAGEKSSYKRVERVERAGRPEYFVVRKRIVNAGRVRVCSLGRQTSAKPRRGASCMLIAYTRPPEKLAKTE